MLLFRIIMNMVDYNGIMFLWNNYGFYRMVEKLVRWIKLDLFLFYV